MGSLKSINEYFIWNEEAQKFSANLMRREILPSQLFFDLSDVVGVETLNAYPSPTAGVSYKQPYFSVNGADEGQGTPFEVRYLTFEALSTDGTGSTPPTVNTANAQFLALLQEIGETRLFMNQPVHIQTLCGTAQQPCWLREPYMFPSQHVIQATFTNLSSVPVNTRMFLDGAQYYTWSPALQNNATAKTILVNGLKKWQQRRAYVTPYWLTTDTPVVLSGGQTANFNSKIGDDGHVELFTLMVVSTGPVGFSIQEVKTKQTLMNGTVTGTNAAGNATFPSILATPYLVPAGYNLQYTVTDLSGTANNVYFTWQARKIYAPFKDVKTVLTDTKMPVSGVDRPARSVAVTY